MSEEKQAREKKGGGCGRALFLVIGIAIGLAVVWLGASVISGPEPTPTVRSIFQEAEDTVSCSVNSYRISANPIMEEVSDVTESTDISSANSRAEARRELDRLLDQADRLRCKDEYPLKHETLVFTIQHTIDALSFMDDGDFAAADDSLDAAIINAERFNDWTVDVD